MQEPVNKPAKPKNDKIESDWLKLSQDGFKHKCFYDLKLD